ncbi:hypothetical protein ATZ36_17765 [Candidatus Endomicrobiellum trichonymphae]|uniref:Uncharacterized protein n=1 Tax=Endomicrobium trichonymphae TaxID=1408204 RepID=A0A1E5IK56_ENDTX|nr:hypothetical protein ATZ36_17765 [Candidatus Endomicrobium trichonymphae]
MKKNQFLYLKDCKIDMHLFYGKDTFSYLTHIWDGIVEHLKSWKTVVLDLSEVNFHLALEIAFNEIKDLSVALFKKLLSNNEVYNQILLTLFP